MSNLTSNDDYRELMEAPAGVGTDPYYAYGQGQGGAAWHAVLMARRDKEAE